MSDFPITFYYLASSPNHGPLGIFHIHGDEAFLIDALDRELAAADGQKNFNSLAMGGLQYGWLFSERGGAVDEVMLAKPRDDMRVLMTHGGAGVRKAVSGYLEERGCEEAGDWVSVGKRTAGEDDLSDPLLAGCITTTQISTVIRWRSGEISAPPGYLMATHRLVVAGPPNAGKSSLLNRLAGYDRAFVHPEAGATRDVVDELVDLGGYAVLVGDMPGYSEQSTGLDAVAWDKARQRLELADAVLFVVDGSIPWEAGAEKAAEAVARCGGEGRRVLVVLNKSDLPPAIDGEPWLRFFPHSRAVAVCSLPDGDVERILAENAAWLFVD